MATAKCLNIVCVRVIINYVSVERSHLVKPRLIEGPCVRVCVCVLNVIILACVSVGVQ